MPHAVKEVVVILLAAGLAGCAPAHRQHLDSLDPPAANVSVAVQNNSVEDMAIYAVNGIGGRWRLGTVQRLTSGNLILPHSALSSWGLQLVARPIGAASEWAFTCTPPSGGATVTLMLDHYLPVSSCWTR